MAAQEASEDTIKKFAQVLCEEADAASLEIGAATPDQLMPWHQLNDEQKAVYENLARRLFKRLYYSPVTGSYTVLPKQGG